MWECHLAVHGITTFTGSNLINADIYEDSASTPEDAMTTPNPNEDPETTPAPSVVTITTTTGYSFHCNLYTWSHHSDPSRPSCW